MQGFSVSPGERSWNKVVGVEVLRLGESTVTLKIKLTGLGDVGGFLKFSNLNLFVLKIRVLRNCS